jgi:hypothetical protein
MVVCFSCHRDFKTIQGVTKHRNTCKNALAEITSMLLKEKRRSDLVKALKKAQRKGGEGLQDKLSFGGPLNPGETDVRLIHPTY